MPKPQINSMYPEHIYNYGSDVIEKLTSIGAKIIKRTSSPARINDVILKSPKFWLDVTVTQGNDYRWNFDVSVSADSESYDDYNESKRVPIDTKRSVQFYAGQLTKLIKQMISKLKSEFGDTGQMNMFESKKSKLIESAITKIVRRVMKEGADDIASAKWKQLQMDLIPYLEKKYGMDIGAGHLGNGITVWDRSRQKNGDYMSIFHIGQQGQLSIYDPKLKSDPKMQVWNK